MAATAKRVRGANGEGGVRQRPSGRWEARAAIVDAAGRLHRHSVTADTEREAKRRLRELVAQHEAGILAPDGRETMARFLTSWLEGVKPTLRPRSWDRYEEHVRLHLIPTLGRIPLTRLSPMDVQRANNELLKMGLAPATVCRAHATLRAALKQGAAVAADSVEPGIASDAAEGRASRDGGVGSRSGTPLPQCRAGHAPRSPLGARGDDRPPPG